MATRRRVSPDKTPVQMKQRVLSVLSATPTRALNYKQIARKLGVTSPSQKAWISSLLQQLAREKTLQEPKTGFYKMFSVEREIIGFVEKKMGTFYAITDEKGHERIVGCKNRLLPLRGDTVAVRVASTKNRGGVDGEIVKVIERACNTFVGKVVREARHEALVEVVDRSSSFEIAVKPEDLQGAQVDDKVYVRVESWGKTGQSPRGKVESLLGRSGENNTEMHAILASHGLPLSYPLEAEKEAGQLPDTIDPEELRQREDFRDVLTVTIDPDDAKDFDDALSIRELSNGNFEVGVHIADVSHFVRVGTKIDEEAYARATSIYLVDRTIPMLPERLCNDHCSLKPQVDRYAYSCVFEMTDTAQVVKYRVVKTVINSNARLTYNDAQKIIEGEAGNYQKEILALHSLATILRKKRFEDGSIRFESREVKFKLDEQGKPIGVYPYETKESNHLVEEFMLLANRTVAEAIGKTKQKTPKTFVYRIHNAPDVDRIEQLSKFVSTFGHKLKVSTDNAAQSQAFNRLLQEIKGSKEENLISVLMVRSLARAEYSTQNIGHYGLGFDFYTHFTSPIRRYPDLMVHRLLSRYIQGGTSENAEKYEEYAKHCSEQEQIASDAERDSIKYKQVEYMSQFVGKHFDGIISNVLDWGIFVELNESMCTGLVSMRRLGNDYFDLDEKNHCLVGRKTKKRYTLGDPITVRVVRCDLEQRQLDFDLA